MTAATPTPASRTGLAGGAAMWVLRVLWLLQPLAVGPLLTETTNALPGRGAVIVAVSAWAAWAVTLLCTVVPSTISMTVGRMLAPVSLVASAVAALGADASGWKIAAALGGGAAAAAWWCTGEVGVAMAQGSAYGAEHRFPLAPPAAYVVPMLVSWLVTAVVAVIAVTLLANAHWIVGAIVAAVAVALARFVGDRFHRLSRRWLVVVPAGIVLHDPALLVENMLFRSTLLRSVHLAPVGSEAADLTGAAAGSPIEIVLKDTETIVKVGARDQPRGVALHVLSVLASPSRPGRALATAAELGHPVG